MLIVTAENKSHLANVSDYDVWVGLNEYRIWGGLVTGHLRANGAAALLRKIADAMEQTKKEDNESTPTGFAGAARNLMYGRSPSAEKRREGSSPSARDSKS